MSLLARRYARALFESTEEAAATGSVSSDLAALRDAFDDPELRAVVLDPDTTGSVRRKALAKVTANAHELTRNLVGVVLERRRQALLPDLHAAFEALALEKQGIVTGQLETALPLADAERATIERTAAKLVGKTVRLEVRENRDLLGGIRLRVGNTLYDGSVQTALAELEKHLLQGSL